MITTSRTAIGRALECMRLRWWAYEAPNGTDTPGWERRRYALPLVTGIYVHRGLEELLQGVSPDEAACNASETYLAEVGARGLAVEQGTDEALVVEEQAAHVEALVLAWARVRLPRWNEAYEVVEVEKEDRVALSDDVLLATRADAIVRRKEDRRLFIINFKTVGSADERWLRQWEVDMQLMTELLAAEARFGETFGGVIIEGLVKGQRVGVDDRLVEIRDRTGEKRATSYIDRSRLLYGYKCDADPPLVPLQYQWESTTRKGWYKFRTWREQQFTRPAGMSPLQYWIGWLPEEVVEGVFEVVPPIYRDQLRIESKVRQIVALERRIQAGREQVRLDIAPGDRLDEHFPQNEHACVYPGRCQMYEMCHERGVAEDPAGSGLYIPRIDHHKLEGA